METTLTGFGFLIGIVLGSLGLNLAERSLQKKSSFWGRSYCPKCKHKLHWYDLFPIFSYLILQGQCRYCHRAIGKEYLLVEVVMGILIGFLFWQQFDNFKFEIFNLNSNFKFIILNFKNIQIILDVVFKAFFITILSVLFLTDLKKMLIPDRIVLPAIKISIIFMIFITIIKVIFLYYSLDQTVIGKLLLPPHSDYFQRHAMMAAEPLLGGIATALAIGGFFTALIMITKGKGMGGGDVKLGALIGIALGFPQALLAIILSFLTGAVFSVALILIRKKHFGQTIPFGPFLVLGALVALFWGPQILEWYLTLGT